MSWNSENRMTESTVLNASTGGKSITRYKYDHEGNRVVKSGRYGEAVYVNQNYSVRNNTIVSKHIFAGGQRVVSKVCDSDANSIMDTGVFYVSTDHLGSSNLLTDKDGNFYEHVETFPCGDIWVREGTNNYNISFKFTGHEKDLETMFLCAKERYLDSQQGVWVSTDRAFESYFPDVSNSDKKLPAGGIYNPRNLNVYSYAYNNPVKYVDPDGNFPILYRIANSPIVQRSVRWVSNTPVGRFVGRQTDKLYYAMAAGGRWVVRNAPRAWNGLKTLNPAMRIRAAQTVQGLYGRVSIKVLNNLMRSNGSTIQVYTRLTQKPEIGRALSVATGPGAKTLANAARNTGQLFQAKIPTQLLNKLVDVGLAFPSKTIMNGKVAIEYRFSIKASEYIAPFFKK